MHLRDEATEVEQTLGMAAVEELDASLLEDVLQSGDVLKSALVSLRLEVDFWRSMTRRLDMVGLVAHSSRPDGQSRSPLSPPRPEYKHINYSITDDLLCYTDGYVTSQWGAMPCYPLLGYPIKIFPAHTPVQDHCGSSRTTAAVAGPLRQ